MTVLAMNVHTGVGGDTNDALVELFPNKLHASLVGDWIALQKAYCLTFAETTRCGSVGAQSVLVAAALEFLQAYGLVWLIGFLDTVLSEAQRFNAEIERIVALQSVCHRHEDLHPLCGRCLSVLLFGWRHVTVVVVVVVDVIVPKQNRRGWTEGH